MFQYLDIASLSSNNTEGHIRTRIVLPYCKFNGKHPSQNCSDISRDVKTPIGKCITINPKNQIGKVKRVGEKYGLELAIDQGPAREMNRRFKNEVVSKKLLQSLNFSGRLDND